MGPTNFRRVLIASVLALGIGTAGATGHDELILTEEYGNALFACFAPQKSAKVVDSGRAIKWGRTLYIIRADRNYDGGQDLMLVYEVDGRQQPMPFPHYYVLDVDFDGKPDKAYRDMEGNGRCEQMQEVPLAYVLSDGERES